MVSRKLTRSCVTSRTASYVVCPCAISARIWPKSPAPPLPAPATRTSARISGDVLDRYELCFSYPSFTGRVPRIAFYSGRSMPLVRAYRGPQSASTSALLLSWTALALGSKTPRSAGIPSRGSVHPHPRQHSSGTARDSQPILTLQQSIPRPRSVREKNKRFGIT